MKVDSATLSALGLKSATAASSSAGGFANTYRLVPDGESGDAYFVKTGPVSSANMLNGEFESLKAIYAVVQDLVPKPGGAGRLVESSGYFFACEFLHLGGRGDDTALACKLGKLHTEGKSPDGKFGFHTVTCCGSTEMDNTPSESWPDFFAKQRLMAILSDCEKNNGKDASLRHAVEQTAYKVVPRLLGQLQVEPVLVHGDLWSGNAGATSKGPIIYDPCCFYAHSEYELGIMKMFGGFGTSFLKAYHERVPKTSPVDEYADRVALYQVYHQLNHASLFGGGGYQSSALQSMKRLITKYT